MNNNHLYRQEYIRLLWVHTQQVTNQSAKINEQRRALKVQQKRKLKSLRNGLDLFKRAYLTFRHLSETRQFNSMAEYNHARLLSEQQEEIRRLKSSWELQYSTGQAI